MSDILQMTHLWGGMWALLPQPWTFTLVLKVGFPRDLQIQQKVKASPSFMVNLASLSSVWVCQR